MIMAMRGVDALPHLDLRHDQRDLSSSPIRMKALGAKLACRGGGERQAETQQQRARPAACSTARRDSPMPFDMMRPINSHCSPF